MSRSTPVLMYHHIKPEAGMITSSPKNFESQLQDLIKHGYRTISLSELEQHYAGKNIGKAAVITLDDGYLDNWVYAFPLLKKYNCKANIFLVTSWINQGPVRPNTATCTAADELPPTPRHQDCEALAQQGKGDDVILRWSEIKTMQESGLVEFHCHTHTHTRWDLTHPTEKNARIKEELELSRQSLVDNLGMATEHLCWPQGYFDDDYVEIAQQAGFKYLYTTKAFGRNTPTTPTTRIHRFHVRNRPGNALIRRMRATHHPIIGPVYNKFKNVRHKLQGRDV